MTRTKVGITIGDGENGTKKPTAVRQLGTALPFGATPASRLRSILPDAKVFGGETELTAIAACRGLEASSDELKLKVGMLATMRGGGVVGGLLAGVLHAVVAQLRAGEAAWRSRPAKMVVIILGSVHTCSSE